MKDNPIYVYFLLPLLGGAIGYTLALDTAPHTPEDSAPSQTLSVEPSSAPETVASVANDLRNGEFLDDNLPTQQADSDSNDTMRIAENNAPPPLAEDNPSPSPSEYERHPIAADQADPETRIELVQTLPVRDNLDTLTRLLLEDPLSDVRRTVLERLANEEDTANDVSVVNTLDAVLRNENDASVIRAALEYYKKLGEQYAYNACLALTQRDDLSAFALGQAYSFLVDNELIGPADASYYVMQSPSFAKLGSDEKEYMMNDVLTQSVTPDEQEVMYY